MITTSYIISNDETYPEDRLYVRCFEDEDGNVSFRDWVSDRDDASWLSEDQADEIATRFARTHHTAVLLADETEEDWS